jgi:hypothetical protein
MIIKRTFAMLAILAGYAGTISPAAATPTWPSSIVGTWNGVSNLTQIILTVSQQTSGGRCQLISGTIEDVPTGVVGNMQGYYCPYSGNVEFLRYPTNSTVAFQVYSANLAQNPPPKNLGLLMAGTFGQYSQSYGPLGQYSFSLVK